MSACGNNKSLDALKAKQAELDSLLQGGKDQLAAVQGKLDAMKADLLAFKPELPKLDSLQDKLNELTKRLKNINYSISSLKQNPQYKASGELKFY